MSRYDDNKIEPLAILIGNRQSGTWRAAEWSLAERILTAGWMKPEDDTLVATWGEVQDLRDRIARVEALAANWSAPGSGYDAMTCRFAANQVRAALAEMRAVVRGITPTENKEQH